MKFKFKVHGLTKMFGGRGEFAWGGILGREGRLMVEKPQ